MTRFVLALLGLIFAAVPAVAQTGGVPDDRAKVEASLIVERDGVVPGGTITIALKEAIRKNWHTYWVNPGDSGAPTTVNWHMPPGWTAGALQWPYPKRLPVGPLMNFGYEGEVALLSDVIAPQNAQPGSTAEISADVTWLVCNDVCIPENTHLALRLPVIAVTPPVDSTAAPLFSLTRAHLPQKSSWAARYDVAAKRFALLLENPALVQDPPSGVDFYPYADGIVEAAAPQREEGSSAGLVLESAPGYKLASPEKRKSIRDVAGLLVLTSARGEVTALDISATPGVVPTAMPIGQEAVLPLALAILFAFAGGLILNLMPCVFPVLSMKALALAAKRENTHAAQASGLAYAAGAVLSFIALAAVLLALRSAGVAIGWGFQLQQPLFVAVLALLMFAIGLNLSGVYEIGIPANFGAGLAGRSGHAGSFFTGVLAVLVATPCTAPFMGAATGYALTADSSLALAVFAALGLGFAAPFLALSFAPGLLRALPRPGPWMSLFRQLLAFPMYGAAVWLIWVLSLQAGSSGVLAALAAATMLAFALWTIGVGASGGVVRWLRSAAAVVALTGAGVLVAQTAGGTLPEHQGTAPAGQSINYEPFSAEKLAALQQSGRPVFVNATAAWCITCLVNEKLALSGGPVARAFAGHNVAALRADWTNQDSAITALLARHGRSGVPLYLYFPPHAASPVVLPQLLTESTVISAVEKGG